MTDLLRAPLKRLKTGSPEQVVWRARLVLGCLLLVALCFHQAPGKIVPDTKLDLTANPGAFLARALHLWDPQGAFGQLQNQAYGYLLPMGPFHWLFDSLSVPDWAFQRLWWSLVLCTAFVGVWKLAGALGYGAPWARFTVALLYALSPRMLGEVAITSIEVWPIAMAPWVLLPLVTPRARSGWWRVGWSAVAFALVGGVNAVATGATLVLPALWILTRRLDRATLKIAVGWFGCIVAVSFWWLVPLLLLGRHSPPFLDWIENAATTTNTASIFESFRGTSQWLNFLATGGGPSWPAGWLFVTQPTLILTTAVVALVGLVGLAMGSLKNRGFLQLSVVAGLLLLTLGHHSSPLSGPVQDLLDGPLAALRNTHKFELVVRLPLALAAAHALTRLSSWATARGVQRRLVPALAACLVVSVATPAMFAQLPRTESYQAMPAHWSEAATWLDSQPTTGSVLVVPAASFADFTWGSTKDEPFQALLKRPMAVRDAVPLGSAGTTRWLDELERRLGSGVGDKTLVQALNRAGIRYVVVRNDLRNDVQVSPALAVHESLAEAGIARVAYFGPPTGSPIEEPGLTLDERTRLPYPSVEIFDVGEVSPARVVPQSQLVEVRGGSEDVPSVLTALGPDREAVLSTDVGGLQLPLIQTDGLQRREVTVGRAAENYSPVLTAQDPGRQGRRTLDYVLDPDAPQTTRSWDGGLADVRASSSAADVDATLRTGPGNGPFAAVDGDPATRWVSGTFGQSSGEWLELTFTAPRRVDDLQVQFSLQAPTTDPVRTLKVETDAGSLTTVVEGNDRPQHLPAPEGVTQRLRLSVAVTDGRNPNGVAIAEVSLPGLTPVSRLQVPAGPDRQPDALIFRTAQAGRSACLHSGTRPLCRQGFARDSEEPTGLYRSIDLPDAASYTLQGTALPRDGAALERLLVVPRSITATASSRAVTAPEGRPGAAVDTDLGTGWIAAPGDPRPTLTLKLPGARKLQGIQFLSDPYLAAARPSEVAVRFDGGKPTTLRVTPEGFVTFPDRFTRVRTVELAFTATTDVVDVDSATGLARRLPVGVAELRILGANDLRRPLDLDAVTGAVCGFGPTVRIDGVPAATKVDATMRDVLQRRPVKYALCQQPSVALQGGRHTVDVVASQDFVPVDAKFTRTDAPRIATDPAKGVNVWRPNPAALTLEVPPVAVPSVLTVAQNFSSGWEAYDSTGRKLVPIRIGGWQQGWLLPAGPEQVVTARFAPDRDYRAGLLVGLWGLVFVAGFAVFSRRRSRHAGHSLRELGRLGPWPASVLMVLAGTFLAGWLGLAVTVLAAVLAWLLAGRRIALTATVVGVVLAGTAVAALQPWPDGGAGLTSGFVQGSVLLGVALAVLSRPAGETS
ncbi:coagulation factor 5/8 type domain protein [Kribbella flavida DSM 17836]|uniref:Coagulation factor 5/8 type domain protein n=1 Tax=Kribbella flavida (strain DSM 17836 / JCM 10339 / NBRC 14399) TaxID=479435 RepID=D2Q335_KRIFD|nr:alpha-(1->3)-arabinofuranosyltransferase [Kribbella flavida]ADB32160.1 coagulation factor 5/8 type domain protein [Kribbella flavida DSM 17836]